MASPPEPPRDEAHREGERTAPDHGLDDHFATVNVKVLQAATGLERSPSFVQT